MENETSPTDKAGVSFNPLLNEVGAKRKYYYMEEITSCVLCGRETKYRWRVYEKPEPHLRVIWKEDACCTHFI